MSGIQIPPELSEKQRRENLYRLLLDVSQAPYERLSEVLQNTTFCTFVPGISLEFCARYLQIDEAIRRGNSPPNWAVRQELRSYRQFFVNFPRKLIEKIRAWLPIEGQPHCPPVYKSESAILEEIRDDLAVLFMLRWLFLNWRADSIKGNKYTPSLTTHVLDRWPQLAEAQAAVSIAFAELTEPYEGADDWRYDDSPPCRTKLPPLSGDCLGMVERAVQGLALVLNQCEQEYAALSTGPVRVIAVKAQEAVFERETASEVKPTTEAPSWLWDDSRGEGGSIKPTNGESTSANGTSQTGDEATPTIPHWDEMTATLYWGETPIREFRNAAKNQRDIIEAFHLENWKRTIPDPLQNPRKLNVTIADLNKSLDPKLIRFRGDGTGEAIMWEPTK